MCTLSWQYRADGLHLLFNRDEQIQRPAALLPERYQENGVTALMPLDPVAGGSWLAVNELGQVWCLLNDYAKGGRVATAGLSSRGMLIKALAHMSARQQQDTLLQVDKLQAYAPFKLVLFQQLQEPIVWHWNGRSLTQHLAVRSPISSSSKLPRGIPAIRRWYWRAKVKDITTAAELLTLQRSSKPVNAFCGLAMQRSTSQTVSTSYLHCDAKGVNFRYWHGHPNTQQVQPDTSLQLAWASALHLQHSGYQPIDLPQLVKSAVPAFAARLRPWQWYGLQHCLAQRQLNQALQQLSAQPDQRFCDSALQYLRVEPQLVACRWPSAESRPVFVANHPTGGLDGLMLIALLQKRYPNLQVVANDLLQAIVPLQANILPVSVFAKPAAAVPQLTAAFASGQPLLIFPAGRTARFNAQHQLDDGVWAKLAITLCRREQRSLTLIHIDSRNSRLFYALAALRLWFGIKTNLEMLLLSREMLKPAVKHPKIFVDVPMHPVELDALADTDRQRAQRLKRRGMQLPILYKEQQDAAGYTSCGRSRG